MRIPLVMPDLELPRVRAVAGCWLARPGSPVVEGDRVLEVIAGDATVDLPAPATGRLTGAVVREGDGLAAGQVLAFVETDGDAS